MKVGIIADDLTGANATGVRMSKTGFHPATYFYYNDLIMADEIDALVIDTDSRYSSKKILDFRINTSLKKLENWGADFYCKRVDSTMRGNVGNEINLVLDYLGDEAVAVVVPSFPDSGRIIIGGYLLVDNIPLHKTDAANDPIMPITSSYVPEILETQTNHSIGVLTINDLNGDESDFIERFCKQIETGKRIIVIDAATNDDIEFIGSALSKCDLNIVPVDPGPFTSVYAKHKVNQHEDDSKIIITVGSATKVSEKQLVYLIDRLELTPIIPNINNLATFDERWHEEVNKCVQRAKEEMEVSSTIVVTTNEENLVIIDIKGIADAHGVAPERVTKRITDGLATITKRLIDETSHPIKGVYTSGGDVTASLTSLMMASGITLVDEVAPLTAYGKLRGGSYHGLPIITKGGMIGDFRTLYESIQYLRARQKNTEEFLNE